MAAEHVLVPQSWRRALGAARIALASACLAAQWLAGAGSALTAGALAAYLAYGVAALIHAPLQRGGLLLFGLLLDTVFFLICTMLPPAAALWLAASWFFYLQASALLLHGWQQAALAGGVACGFLAVIRPNGWAPVLGVCGSLTAISLVAAWQKRQLEERLFGLSRQALQFRASAETGRQEERERIANDFHDGPLQAFMSVQMRLEVVRRLLIKDSAAGLKELVQLQDLLRSQVAELRAFLRSLRQNEVQVTELAASLSRFAETFQKDTGISVTLSGTAALGSQPPEMAAEILHMIQEALHNVRKHSQATCIAVSTGCAGRELQISIDDNGVGFPFSGVFTLEELELLRLGPASIKRRVRALNGQMTLESSPGRGAGLRIHIPL